MYITKKVIDKVYDEMRNSEDSYPKEFIEKLEEENSELADFILFVSNICRKSNIDPGNAALFGAIYMCEMYTRQYQQLVGIEEREAV